MTSRNTSTHPLTELQQAILDVLWAQGPATADDVRKALKPRHPLTDSSVRTLLRRLEARGFLSHRTEGKVFIYRAEMRAQSVAARAVQAIIRRFCAGSVEQFITGMVDERIVSAEELQRLARRVKGRSNG